MSATATVPRIDMIDACPLALAFRVLGEPEVVGPDGRPVPVTAGQWAVLAFLLERANQRVSGEVIKDRLWSEKERCTSQLLHTNVSNIRRRFDQAAPGAPSVLPRLPFGYRLEVEPWQVDATRFERLAAAGRRAADDGDDVVASTWLGAAIGLANADADHAGSSVFSASFLAWFEERLREVRTRLIEVRLARGEHASLVPELTALRDADPIDVGLTIALMTALYRSGRARDALDRAEQCRQALIEVGLNEGPILKRAALAIINDELWLAPPRSAMRTMPGPGAWRVVLAATWPPRSTPPGRVGDAEFALVVPENGGRVLSIGSPGFTAAFPTTDHALLAAQSVQRCVRLHGGVPATCAIVASGQRMPSCRWQLERRAVELLKDGDPGELLVRAWPN